MNTTTNNPKTAVASQNREPLYNTQPSLWASYAAHLAKGGRGSVSIYPDGSIVKGGIQCIARFSNRRTARKTLTANGWTCFPALGMGSCTRALIARPTALLS